MRLAPYDMALLAELRHEGDIRDRQWVDAAIAQQDRDREAAFQDEMRRG